MGVAAPLPESETQLFLAAEAASKALGGNWNLIDAATHICIYISHFDKSPPELQRIVNLSERIAHASALTSKLESELRDAMSAFLRSRQ
jgi:hypothetical protein